MIKHKQRCKFDNNFNEVLYEELDQNDNVIYWRETTYFLNSNTLNTSKDSDGWINKFYEVGVYCPTIQMINGQLVVTQRTRLDKIYNVIQYRETTDKAGRQL